MGIPVAQAAQPISQQQPQGKGAGSSVPATFDPNAALGDARSQLTATSNVMPQPDSTMSGAPHQNMGKGSGKNGGQPYIGQPNEFTMSDTTNSATSGQPRMGQANPYPNTIQPWDNASIQPQTQSGKGKGH